MGIQRVFSVLALSAAALLLPGGPVGAMDFSLPRVDAESYASSIAEEASYFGISEVRLGPAFSNLELLPKLLVIPDSSSLNKARLDSLQFDVLFRPPQLEAWHWIGSPRPSIGGVIGLGGYESLIHAGIDWHIPLGSTPFYLEAGGGVGIHNGYLDHAPPGFHNLGCRTLLHWEAGAGWNLSPNVDVTLQWQHMSNVVFGCDPNDGLNDIGMVVGWKF
ncbi:MAG: acyloxyacyl hydrolase [Devosia sp.]|nr:acyloxyacyl hydrolase [Devosia sp.]